MNAPSSTFKQQAAGRLLSRQRQLLALLHGLGGKVNKLDFQKLLFLYCQESGNRRPYEFVPYRFGAFSFTSYADLRKLIARGFLAEKKRLWQITSDGTKIARCSQDGMIASFVYRHQTRGDRLVAETYAQFPYYATRSEIAEKVLCGDNVTLRRIDAAQPKASSAPLLTIGYEGRTLENYLNLLLHAGVTLLCDVRRNAISRKYGFSKNTLKNACDGVDISYRHMPELGISADRRRALKTMADRQKLFREYERHDLRKHSHSLGEILRWIHSDEHIALTCYESDPKACHRQRVATEIERQSSIRFCTEHL